MTQVPESEAGIAWGSGVDNYAVNVAHTTKIAVDRVLGLAESLQSFDENSEVLDVGAGTGVVTASITENHSVHHILATDISEKMLGSIERKNLPKVTTQILDQLDLDSLGRERFTHIFSTFSVQFIKEPMKVVEGAYRCLKPGGVFGLGVWGNVSSVLEIWAEACQYIDPSFELGQHFEDPNAWRTTEELEAAFKQAGFVGLTYETVDAPFPFPSSEAFLEYWFNGNNPGINRFVKRWKGDLGPVKERMQKTCREQFRDGKDLKLTAAVCCGRKSTSQ